MKKYKHKRTGIIVEMGVANKNYYYAYKENEAIVKWVIEDSLDWEEIRQIAIVTEDGKELFEEDDCILFSVCPEKLTLGRHSVKQAMESDDFLNFFTKEARQEYIDNHEPKYSLFDIRQAFNCQTREMAIILNEVINRISKQNK